MEPTVTTNIITFTMSERSKTYTNFSDCRLLIADVLLVCTYMQILSPISFFIFIYSSDKETNETGYYHSIDHERVSSSF